MIQLSVVYRRSQRAGRGSGRRVSPVRLVPVARKFRSWCEAADAHESFALIFPKRMADIAAVAADQCKVLVEGFGALCFGLQVARNAMGASGGGQAGAGIVTRGRTTARM